MFKKIMFMITLTTLLLFSVGAIADKGIAVILPDGQSVTLDGLEDSEKQVMINLLNKISKAKATKEGVATEAAKVMAEVISDPAKLDSWRKLITGTIKDICEDLNISVNEFIKTPAGIGVAALIIYKVAGKEVLSEAADVVLGIPMWIVMMIILFYLQKKYLGFITVYHEEQVNEKGKVVGHSNPKRMPAYEWGYKGKDSDEANAGEAARVVFSCFLYGTGAILTFVTILLVFC